MPRRIWRESRRGSISFCRPGPAVADAARSEQWFAFPADLWSIIAPLRPGRTRGCRKRELFMQTQTESNAVLEKTRELCQTIVDDPALGLIRQRVDAFLANDQARGQYESVMSKGQALQEKQQRAEPLTSEEISDFEKHREQLLGNPIARGFLDAQEQLHEIQHSIHKYVSKTLELGRVPGPEDLEESCGHGGCGCHH